MATLLTYALCVVADVKELLGIDAGDTSKDNLITRKINQATEMIERYTGRRFKETTYTNEEYDATGIDQLILRQRPVTAISGIGSRDTSSNISDFDTIDSQNYFYDGNAGIVEGIYSFIGGYNRYRVTYTAGYSAISWPDALPADLREACALLAAYFTQNPVTGQGVKSKSEGQRSVTYFDSSPSRTIFEQLGIDEILDSYSNYPILANK